MSGTRMGWTRPMADDPDGHIWADCGGYEFVRRVGAEGLMACCLCGTLRGVRRTCPGDQSLPRFYAQVTADLRDRKTEVED